MARIGHILRLLGAFGIAAVALLALARVFAGASNIVQRECYRAAEAIGIMSPNGPLGGQIAGFNYQRSPEWVHVVAEFVASLVAFLIPVIAGLLIFQRLALGPLHLRATLCGHCGSRLHNLKTPACHCCGASL